VITITGNPDDEALARSVLESLRTTTDAECYRSLLEQLVRAMGG
jgi:hypothetical protein